MRRDRWPEIEDAPWCPPAVRDAVTLSIRCLIDLSLAYEPLLGRLRAALECCGSRHVLDLGSGAGGPWPRMHRLLAERERYPVDVVLTDKYPNRAALAHLAAASGAGIVYHPEPVDAARIPEGLDGFRTFFSCFHHFDHDTARAILADAARRGQGIAVVESTRRHPRTYLAMLAAAPLAFFVAPFLRPFRWSRLFWTYIVPLVPVVLIYDGLVSCARTYTAAELRALVDEIPRTDGYAWEIGETRAPRGSFPVTWLIGCPVPSVLPRGNAVATARASGSRAGG